MNLVDELGNDLAVAFLVEKKYSKKIDAKESLALLGKIREALRQLPAGKILETKAVSAANSGDRGN